MLGGTVGLMAIRGPWDYWRDAVDQMFQILKQCWIPMAVSCTFFGLGAPGLQGGNLYNLFGMPERLGSFFIMASIREFAPWVNAMVVAGVVGSAITADLGARRIRDEIDAMEVLGVDPIRALVLPRVVAVTIITGLLDVVALCFGLLGGFIAVGARARREPVGVLQQPVRQPDHPGHLGQRREDDHLRPDHRRGLLLQGDVASRAARSGSAARSTRPW